MLKEEKNDKLKDIYILFKRRKQNYKFIAEELNKYIEDVVNQIINEPKLKKSPISK